MLAFIQKLMDNTLFLSILILKYVVFEIRLIEDW